MKIKLNKISENVVRNSQECFATVVRVSGDYHATVVRYICKIRSKFTQLLHDSPFYETAM